MPADDGKWNIALMKEPAAVEREPLVRDGWSWLLRVSRALRWSHRNAEEKDKEQKKEESSGTS
jgi:hypothetical protein